MADAPHLLDHLDTADAEHFEEVKELLGAASVEFTIDPTLVRGLDYYTRTIFSFVCSELGAQSEIGGGGRYDGLIKQLGGPDTPAIGWAAGIERILLALDEEVELPGTDLFIAVGGKAQQAKAVALASELRHHGLSVELDLAGRSMKGQLKQADRIRSANTLVFEEDGTSSLSKQRDQRAAAGRAGSGLGLIRP
jgi:histidyl-tRNA synthetase